MKNASKHAEELKSLCRRLGREFPAPPKQRQEPLAALVRGAMSYDVSEHRADEAMRFIEREFVGLNELRVATQLEVQELLGSRYPGIEERVGMITHCLNAIFEREGTLSLERMTTISRRDARQFIRELPEVHPFVEAYVMLFAFDVAAMPLDERMLAYLREEGIVEPSTALEDAQRFLEHHLKAEECHALFHALRRATVETAEPKAKAGKKGK